MSEHRCELCGEPMPPGEEMFRYHGHSGPCPKPPKTKESNERDREMAREFLAPYPDLRGLVMEERLAEKIAAARAEERERCAKIAVGCLQGPDNDGVMHYKLAEHVASRIRSGQ